MRARAFVLALLLTAVCGWLLPGCGGGDSTDFVGSWREMGSDSRCEMRIEATGDDAFKVVYPRFFPSFGEFRLESGKLTYSPVTPDMTYVITSDSAANTITITSDSSGRSYKLTRIQL